MASHFFKILFVFLGMIVVGLFGVFVVNYLDDRAKDATAVDVNIEVAK